MAIITGISTATPPYRYNQDEVKQYVKKRFNSEIMDQVFANAKIRQRYLSLPLEQFSCLTGFESKNNIAIESSLNMLDKCYSKITNMINPAQIRYIISANTTFMANPSIEVLLMNKHKEINRNATRIPMWGLGCAAGAGSLIRANNLSLNDDESILILSVETCSLTYLESDKRIANLIACSIFGDGAAACAMSHEATRGLRILGTKTLLWENTMDIMGWDVVNEGFKVRLLKNIPEFVVQNLKDEIENFLQENNITTKDVKYFLAHPGGRKVIEAFEEIIGDMDSSLTWQILESYGNISSATVFFVLKEYLNNYYKSGDLSLCAALGPGFSCELLLLETI